MTNQEILAAMAKQFLEPQITKRMEWVELDGTQGITFIAVEDAPAFDRERLDDSDYVAEVFEQRYESTVQSAGVRKGYGARLSAPGYMDCTEWSVFPTAAEAEQYLVDTYGDDIEEEDGDNV